MRLTVEVKYMVKERSLLPDFLLGKFTTKIAFYFYTVGRTVQNLEESGVFCTSGLFNTVPKLFLFFLAHNIAVPIAKF